MKNIIFNVLPNSNSPISTLVKVVCNMDYPTSIKFVDDETVCKCTENLEKVLIKIGTSKIGIYNYNDAIIDIFIDFIGNSYEIVGIDIDNTNSEYEPCNEDSSSAVSSKMPAVSKAETILTQFLGNALQEMNREQSVVEQAKKFLSDIDFEMSESEEEVIVKFLVFACGAPKISYASIKLALRSNNVFDEKILGSLVTTCKDTFDKWYKKQYKLMEYDVNISFITFVKVFVKQIKKL